MDFLIIGFFWLMFSAAVASFASNRGRCGICWLISSLVFSPLIGFLFVAASPNLAVEKKLEDEKREQEQQTDTEIKNSKTCPMCAESVKKAAKLCRYCGYEFDEETVATPDLDEETVATPDLDEAGTYKGYEIKFHDDKFVVDGNQYKSIESARAYIDHYKT